MSTIDITSPERGWLPFMEWLEEHGIRPGDCWAVDVGDGEDPRCVAHLYALDAAGEKYVIGPSDDRRVAIREPLEFVARRPAPRRRA